MSRGLTTRNPKWVKTGGCPVPLDGVKGKTAACGGGAQDGTKREVTVKVTEATLLNVGLDVLAK